MAFPFLAWGLVGAVARTFHSRSGTRTGAGNGGWPRSAASIRGAGRLPRNQFDSEIAEPVEQSVQPRLVTDLADKHGLVGAGVQGHPLRGGLGTPAQPPPQHD